MEFLKLENISHVYISEKGYQHVIKDISVTMKEGEFLSFLGPSGCGKTTLLSIISGLLPPTEGTITLKNEKITGQSNQIGYMLQQDYLFPWRTVLDNALLGLEIQGKLSEENKNYVTHLLLEVGLQKSDHLFPSELSGGMKQRAALVRTLATNPELLLLDEPFSALDQHTKLKLEMLVEKTLHALKKSAILVTHDISEAISMSDRILLFEGNGSSYKEFIVPENLRRASPIQARNHPAFQTLFAQIWKEFEEIETKSTKTI